MESVSRGTFKDFCTFRLFSGKTPDADCGGSALPLTPASSDDSVLVATAGHCVHGKQNLQLTPKISGSWHLVDSV